MVGEEWQGVWWVRSGKGCGGGGVARGVVGEEWQEVKEIIMKNVFLTLVISITMTTMPQAKWVVLTGCVQINVTMDTTSTVQSPYITQ